MKNKILWFTIGGTIDAEAYEGEAPVDVIPRNPSGMSEDLASVGLVDRCEFIEICHEDSKDVTDAHLMQIVDEIEKHPEHKEIRVSLGTDALMECEFFIEREMQARGIEDRTVIFVAAMEPLANDPESKTSHAWDNARKAVEAEGKYPPGFYVIGDARSEILNVTDEDAFLKYHLAKDTVNKVFEYRTCSNPAIRRESPGK